MSNLTYIDPEKFEEARDLKLCLKRNFKELTFTTRSILEERKRILVEIQREDLKYINLSGNDRRIKRVLFDYKLGKGFVIASLNQSLKLLILLYGIILNTNMKLYIDIVKDMEFIYQKIKFVIVL